MLLSDVKLLLEKGNATSVHLINFINFDYQNFQDGVHEIGARDLLYEPKLTYLRKSKHSYKGKKLTYSISGNANQPTDTRGTARGKTN